LQALYSHFGDKNSIYWKKHPKFSTQNEAWYIGGDIHERWKNMGWEKSILGYPKSDTIHIETGAQYNYPPHELTSEGFGPAEYTIFEHGELWKRNMKVTIGNPPYPDQNPLHPVIMIENTEIITEWRKHYDESINDNAFGYPLVDETDLYDEKGKKIPGGRTCEFQSGWINWNPAKGIEALPAMFAA
jgi:uncharacterized protein with LGFP repeats